MAIIRWVILVSIMIGSGLALAQIEGPQTGVVGPNGGIAGPGTGGSTPTTCTDGSMDFSCNIILAGH